MSAKTEKARGDCLQNRANFEAARADTAEASVRELEARVSGTCLQCQSRAESAESEASALREQNESSEKLLAQRAQDIEQHKERVFALETEKGALKEQLSKVEARERELQHDLQKVSLDAGARERALRERIERAIALLDKRSHGWAEDVKAVLRRGEKP